jgi:ABC-type nitrate/sulfonate/bicarbonate transport system substrate-binding protein
MLTRLDLGSFTPSVLLGVARETGRLAEHGLEVHEHAVASSPAQFRALIAGELDAALTSPDNVLAYRFVPNNPLGATADVKIVSAVDRGMGLALFSREGVTSVEELRGGVFAVDVPNSGFAFAMYAVAESGGLERGDYTVLSLGSTPNRLEALLTGRCDATMLNAGNELLAAAGGATELGRVTDVASSYLGTVLAIAGESVREWVIRLAAALRTTAEAILSGAVDELAADVAARALGLPAELARTYVRGLKDERTGLVRDGVVDRASMEAVLGLRRRYEPVVVDGVDLLADALEPASGLVAPPPQGTR